MKAQDFRRIALGLKGAVEGAHRGHPDFRVNGRIFATLHADNRHGVVKLTPDEQRTSLADHPDIFTPESGAWGRQGYTRVQLDAADDETVGEALTRAWQNVVNLPAPRRSKPQSRLRTP